MTTKIVLKEEVPKNPVIIEGFPSKGFVSTIVSRYMIDELDMKLIGHLFSDKLGSIAIIHDSEPMYPVRIYSKGNIVLIFSEVIIPFQEIHEISNALTNWLMEIQPKKVILLAGISGKVTEKEHDILGLGTTKELRENLKDSGVTTIDDGMLTGISSDLLLFCFEQNIPTISLMAETIYTPDPMASASMLGVLNKLLKLSIDTEKIKKEGEQIEEMFKKIMEEFKRSKKHHKEMKNLSPMYG